MLRSAQRLRQDHGDVLPLPAGGQLQGTSQGPHPFAQPIKLRGPELTRGRTSQQSHLDHGGLGRAGNNEVNRLRTLSFGSLLHQLQQPGDRQLGHQVPLIDERAHRQLDGDALSSQPLHCNGQLLACAGRGQRLVAALRQGLLTQHPHQAPDPAHGIQAHHAHRLHGITHAPGRGQLHVAPGPLGLLQPSAHQGAQLAGKPDPLPRADLSHVVRQQLKARRSPAQPHHRQTKQQPRHRHGEHDHRDDCHRLRKIANPQTADHPIAGLSDEYQRDLPGLAPDDNDRRQVEEQQVIGVEVSEGQGHAHRDQAEQQTGPQAPQQNKTCRNLGEAGCCLNDCPSPKPGWHLKDQVRRHHHDGAPTPGGLQDCSRALVFNSWVHSPPPSILNLKSSKIPPLGQISASAGRTS